MQCGYNHSYTRELLDYNIVSSLNFPTRAVFACMISKLISLNSFLASSAIGTIAGATAGGGLFALLLIITIIILMRSHRRSKSQPSQAAYNPRGPKGRSNPAPVLSSTEVIPSNLKILHVIGHQEHANIHLAEYVVGKPILELFYE